MCQRVAGGCVEQVREFERRERRPSRTKAAESHLNARRATGGHAAERRYEPNEVVFREGQTGAGVYIIKDGAADIVLRLADGSEQCVVSLHSGQFFGELALLESSPRTATCVVRKPTVLLGLFQPDLEQLLERNAKLGARVVWNLARMTGLRLRELSDLMRSRAEAEPKQEAK